MSWLIQTSSPPSKAAALGLSEMIQITCLWRCSAAPPSTPPPMQHHTPTWIWDGAKQEPYALALQAGPCQASLQQSIAAATIGDLPSSDSHFNGAVNSAALAAGLRQTCRPGTQPSRMSGYSWFDSKCAVLRSQLRRAKTLSPRSAEVRVLQRRYQGKLRRSKVARNHRDVVFLSHLLKILASYGAGPACHTPCCLRSSGRLLHGMSTLLT